MQYESPQYETPDQHQHKDLPDEAESKLGSAQPDNDPFDATSPLAAGIPTQVVAAEQRPVAFRPVEGIPAETQAIDFMTPDGRPLDVRPHEKFPAELR